MELKTKICVDCGLSKPIVDFYVVKNRLNRVYRRSRCTICYNSNRKPPAPSTRLSQDTIQEIKTRYLRGETLRGIALSCGVSKSSVSTYVKGLNRKQPLKLPRRPVISGRGVNVPITKSVKAPTDRPKFVLVENKVRKPRFKQPAYPGYTVLLQRLSKRRHGI